MPSIPFDTLVGKTLISVNVGSYVIDFYTECGQHYRMEHKQDCCEDVSVEDIDGYLEDILHSPVLKAEEVQSTDGNPHAIVKTEKLIAPHKYRCEEEADSFTWTFYKIDTAKGGVCIRWFGESNGYYSEEVDFMSVDSFGEFTTH